MPHFCSYVAKGCSSDEIDDGILDEVRVPAIFNPRTLLRKHRSSQALQHVLGGAEVIQVRFSDSVSVFKTMLSIGKNIK